MKKKVKNKKGKAIKKVFKKKAEAKGKVKSDEVKKLVYEIGNSLMGEYGGKIVDILYEKKDINEFLIAKKIGLTINQIRNLLYKLASKNIVSTIRKRDKKKGWYIYYWTLHTDRALEELKELKIKKLKEIEGEIKSKTSTTFYSCSKNCMIMKEETALFYDFFCPDCGELTHPVSMENEIKKLNLAKEKITKEIEKIDSLIQIFRRKTGEKREKAREREKKKEKEMREKKRKERNKQIAREERKEARAKAKKIREKEKAKIKKAKREKEKKKGKKR